MPNSIFVLGFAGDRHAPIPLDWLDAFATGVTVLAKQEYLDALKLPSDVNLVRVLTYDAGFSNTIASLVEVPGPVLILASGDPGFFGPVRHLREAFGKLPIHVAPATSAIANAFARLGLNWDDAVVISALGSRATAAKAAISGHLRAGSTKLAIMCSPELGAAQIVKLLADRGLDDYRVDIFSHLGFAAERWVTVPAGSSFGPDFDPIDDFAVTVVWKEFANSVGPTLQGGKSPSMETFSIEEPQTPRYLSRGQMITKPEVRAVVIAKLEPWSLAFGATIWDVGAGSGSVGLDILRIRPDLDLISIELGDLECDLIEKNAVALGVKATVVHADIGDVVNTLRRPSAIFIGGGGLGALEAVMAAMDERVRVVATAATLESALAQQKHLADQVMVQIHRSVPLGPNGSRLEPYNPVFVSGRKAIAGD